MTPRESVWKYVLVRSGLPMVLGGSFGWGVGHFINPLYVAATFTGGMLACVLYLVVDQRRLRKRLDDEYARLFPWNEEPRG